MKEIESTSKMIEIIKTGNYKNYQKYKYYQNYEELEKAAKKFFRERTEGVGSKRQKEYYEEFGLEFDEIFLRDKTEKFHNLETNCTAEIYFYEGYIDSGVFEEDYFYGFFIIE